MRRLTELRIPRTADLNNARGARKKKGYGEWNKKTIHLMLTNETYLGHWKYGKRNAGRVNPDDYLIEVKVPAIVDEKL